MVRHSCVASSQKTVSACPVQGVYHPTGETIGELVFEKCTMLNCWVGRNSNHVPQPSLKNAITSWKKVFTSTVGKFRLGRQATPENAKQVLVNSNHTK